MTAQGLCRLSLALFAGLLPAGAAASQEPATLDPEGPVEIRDEQVLAQSRLTLPPIGPDTVPGGRWAFRLGSLRSNSFGWVQDIPGQMPSDRRVLVDGETHTLDLNVARGVGRNAQVAVRVPLRWRGGGFLDGLIDKWHQTLGLPDGDRPYFYTDAFQVEGVTESFQPFSWSDERGTGLGNIEVEGRWRFRDGGRDGWRWAAAARLAVPTGTAPFNEDDAGFGMQVVTAKRLAGPLDLFLGAGGTVQGSGPVRGITYETWRIHSFLAFEWRMFRRFHLGAETDVASRLIRDIDLYPGFHWITNVTGRIPLSRRTRFEIGITENFKNQLATTDFGVHFGLALLPSGKRRE